MLDMFCQNHPRRGYGADDEAYLETDDQEFFLRTDEEDAGSAEWDDGAKRWASRWILMQH